MIFNFFKKKKNKKFLESFNQLTEGEEEEFTKVKSNESNSFIKNKCVIPKISKT